MGKFEVTNAQYSEFLNQVDPAGLNSLSLYSGDMATSPHGGIVFNNALANGTKFAPKVDYAAKPAVFVSWYDTLRFANWLHNGQGTGSTETGAYTLLGNTPTPTNGATVIRSAGATWFLPSESEWHKSAYHKNDGVTSNYWAFTTESDSVALAQSPPGSTSTPGSANYNSVVGSVVNVGSYSAMNLQGDFVSDGPYGTFDQGGNVWEWTEAPISLSSRVIRGGSWIEAPFVLGAGIRGTGVPAEATELVGFRVGMIPEPNTIVGFVFAAAVALGLRRSRAVAPCRVA